MQYSYDGREARRKEKELWEYRHQCLKYVKSSNKDLEKTVTESLGGVSGT